MIHLILHVGRSFATAPDTRRTAAVLAGWLSALATRLIAGSLNMPEALLRDTGDFVIAYVAEVEQRSVLVCPRRVMKDLKRRRADNPHHPSHP